MGAPIGVGTAYPPGEPSFILVSVVVVFVFLSLYFRPLYCLSFELRILIAPLVSSNFSQL